MTLATYLNGKTRPAGSRLCQTHTGFGLGARGQSVRTLHITSGDELRGELYEHVRTHSDLSSGCNSVTEKVVAGANFKLFLDVDFKLARVEEYLKDHGNIDLILILQEIPQAAKSLIDEATGTEQRVIIATRLPYKIHMHFPDMIVDEAGAKRFCAMMKAALQDHPLMDKDSIDTSVYRTGLRLLWCHKGGMGKADALRQEKEAHERVFGAGSWSAVYDITDANTWEKKGERTLEDLELTSIVAEEGAELTPLLFGDERQHQHVAMDGIAHETAMEIVPATREVARIEASYFRRELLNRPLLQLHNPLPEWNVMAPFLLNLGFKQPRLVSQTEDGYNFDASRIDNCPLCATRTHDNNHWYCLQIMPDMFYVKNYSDKCRSEMITREKVSILQDIIGMPDTDADYGKLFSRIYKGILFWTRDGRFMGFQKNKWNEVPKEEVRECCRATLLGILERMTAYTNERKRWMELHDTDKAAVVAVKKEYSNLLVAIRYVKSQRHLKDILECAKDYLWHRDFEKLLDANVHLLGTDNGVVDLKTCEFRVATPDDMVSRSVGYDFSPARDAHDGEFRTFIEQIYPIEEEREVVQRYLGYCLLGDHREKVFLLLTDQRKGYNGKSTMAKMAMRGMGPYMRRGGNGFLYKSDARHETVNSHSAGMIAYKDSRAAYFEELDPKERLNNQELKDRNGGNSAFQGRRINSNVEEQFIWGCKMILLFNDSNFPQFDYTDQALLERMLIVQHRSRFYKEEDAYEQHIAEPYTFRATDVDSKLDAWRPAYLRWALEGLKNYWVKRFSVVPAECKRWKQGLVNEQDLVRDFLREHTCDGSTTGANIVWICGKELYEAYKREVEPEKDKKSRLGPRRFMDRVEAIWGQRPDEEKRIHGEKYRSVFVGKQMTRGESRSPIL